MNNINELWEIILQYLRKETSETAHNLWISKIKIIDFKDGIARLEFENEFIKNIVVSQYGNLIVDAFEKVCGFPVKVEFECPEDKLCDQVKNAINIADLRANLLTFDNFIVGPSNKFAYTAAKAVAADPGGQISKSNSFNGYNPLFIYGNSGLGKTHLLNAICFAVKLNYPEMKVLYVRSEEFLTEFISCLGKNTVDEFHEKYRNVDVLLIDDIQLIAGKQQTEEEFFHTFNAIKDAGKQIVLTSDRPPKEIQSLVDRLRNRFESGLLADIQIPEFETRCAIIERKASLLNFNIPEPVIQFIAEKIKSNIRQLEGATKKLQAMCMFSNDTPTIALAQAAIKDMMNDVQPLPVTIEHIVSEVSRTTGVSSDDIYSKKHTSDVSDARKMCFYIIREVTDMSFKNIGKEFNRDHSTVMYNIEKMGERLKSDSMLNSQVSDIINNIKDSQ